VTITIDASVGGAASNAYCTEVEQIAYMATRLNASAWTTVTGTTCTETEKQAMIEATRELTNKSWIGQRATTTQSQAWPRWNAPIPDSPTGFLFASNVVPQRVKDAACELAFQFLNAGTTDLASADSNQGVTEKTVDVLTTRWDTYRRPTGLSRFTRVMDYIRPLLASSGSSVPLIRG